ncbi:MAG: site-specific integrase [Pseudomonadota bacterium]
MKQKLTKRAIDSFKPRDRDFRVFDTEIPGFHVRVKPSGVKSFAIKYRNAGQQRNFTIGRYGPIAPEQARKHARSLIAKIDGGGDPSAMRTQAQKELTLGEFWRIYLERHAWPHKAPRSVVEDESLWRNHLSPRWSSRKLSSLRREELQRLHAKLSDRPSAANRLLCLVSKMFNLAIDWGFVSDNPARGIKKYREAPRERFLTDKERARLASALTAERDEGAKVAIWLCVLTGARKSEILNARWEQFDLDSERPVWVIPASNTKQARVNRKPLSIRAVELLLEWREKCLDNAAGWLIPGRNPERRRSDLNRPWRRIRESAQLQNVRLHDLRHDFASHAVADGWSLEIIGRYLGHSSIQTTQRYAHLRDDPLHEMAERIGREYT